MATTDRFIKRTGTPGTTIDRDDLRFGLWVIPFEWIAGSTSLPKIYPSSDGVKGSPEPFNDTVMPHVETCVSADGTVFTNRGCNGSAERVGGVTIYQGWEHIVRFYVITGDWRIDIFPRVPSSTRGFVYILGWAS